MKRSKIGLFGLSAVLVLALGACGGQNAKVGDKPLDQARAGDLKTVAPYLGSALVSGVRGAGQSAAAQGAKQSFVSGTCSATTFVDSDKDKVPVGYSASFKDCTEDKLLFIQVTNGNLNINDSNDNDPKSGFTSQASNLAFDFYENKGGGTKGQQFFRIVDNWDLTVGVTSTSASVDYKFSVNLTSFKNGVQDKTWNGSLSFTGSYVPDNDGNLDNFDAGTINLAGTLVLGDFAINETVTDLKFNASCAAGPVSGKIRYDDGQGNFLELSYTGCNTGAFTYNATGSGTF